MSKEEKVKISDFKFEGVTEIPKQAKGGKPKKLFADILTNVKAVMEKGNKVVKVTPPTEFKKNSIPTLRKRANEIGLTASMREGLIYFEESKTKPKGKK